MFKSLIEDVGRELSDIREVLPAAHCCARAYAAESSSLPKPDALPQTMEKHGYLGPFRTVVGVNLVQHEKLEDLRDSRLEEHAFLRSYEQIFEHREIRNQNMRRRLPHLFAAFQLIRYDGLERPRLTKPRQSLFSLPWRLSCVAPESNLWTLSEKLANSFELVVRESIHRINEKRSNSRTLTVGASLL